MKYAASIFATITIFVSMLVIFGWLLDIDLLKRIIPGFVTMKFSTALSFLLGGIILLSTSYREKTGSQWTDIVLSNATLMILLLMGTILLSVLFGFKSGIENLFVPETIDAIFTVSPGQPSMGTMLAFLLIGILGVVAMTDWHSRLSAYRYTGLLIVFLGGIALVGYAFSNPLLFYTIPGISSAMAIHTAALFVVIGVGYVVLSDRNNLGTDLKKKV